MPAEDPPDFGKTTPRRGINWDGTVNVPTLIYATIIIVGGIISYGNLRVDSNDRDWRIKTLERLEDSHTREMDDIRTTLKGVAESVVQTNRTVDHLSQSLDYMQKEKHP